jgi:cell wall-associated NlpC family hydrolase
MLFRVVSALALTWLVTQPQAAYAQVTLNDVTRAIRIGSAILEVTDAIEAGSRRTSTSGRTSTSKRTSSRTAERVATTAGTVIAGRTVSSRTARRAVDTGDDYVGVPYVWGGSTPRGFDCSGFVQYVYRENGVGLPRTSRQMAHAGLAVPVNVRDLREGDLMLFRGRDGVINHVALYAGGNQILHSSSSGNGVRYDDLSSKRGAYFASHFVAARRVTQNGRSLVQSLALIYRKYPFDRFDLPDGAPKIR